MASNLYNIDCLDGMKSLQDESIDSIITDPPYGIKFKPQRTHWNLKELKGEVPNDDKVGKEWAEWFKPMAHEMYRVLKKDSVAWFFCGFSPYYYYYALQDIFQIKADVVWVKNNFGLGYHFRRQYERILCCFKGEPPIPENAMSDIIFEDKINGIDLLHSSQKPEALIRRLLNQYTKPGDIVLDPFVGSGTTGVACREADRNFIGYEISPEYFKIAEQRIHEAEAQIKLKEQ